MKNKLIISASITVIIVLLLTLFYLHISNVNTYTGYEDMKKDEELYNEYISYYQILGFSQEEVETYLNEQNNSIDKDIQELGFFQKLNMYIDYKNKDYKYFSENAIGFEMEYYDSLSDTDKEQYVEYLGDEINEIIEN